MDGEGVVLPDDELHSRPVTPQDLIRVHARIDGHEQRLARVEAHQESTAVVMAEFRLETRERFDRVEGKIDQVVAASNFRRGWWSAATSKESLILLVLLLVGSSFFYMDKVHHWFHEVFGAYLAGGGNGH